ncbi:MAG: energy-coupling factor transporter ATPase [Oscillospiraceae bacterium]|nr:energy-coupling factor transporter ATPase [Oscillospiraceae bacterium]
MERIIINLKTRFFTMDSIIRTEKLYFSYDADVASVVLNGIDLEIEKGTFVAVLGHNGSGKSTLAKHFNALLLPQGGHVYVGGIDTANEELLLEIRRRVGMVFQNPDNQIVATVVEEDVAFAPENLGYPSHEIRERVDEALKMVNMYEYRQHAPHLLSGGQKQRVAIAGVLAMNPQCIVFDEPTAMLDPQGRESTIKTIRELRDKHGVTIVLITHHMEEAIDADRVIVMSEGKIVIDAAPRDVFYNVTVLKNAGLSVPETVQIIHELQDDGFSIDTKALTIEECAKAIFEALK